MTHDTDRKPLAPRLVYMITLPWCSPGKKHTSRTFQLLLDNHTFSRLHPRVGLQQLGVQKRILGHLLFDPFYQPRRKKKRGVRKLTLLRKRLARDGDGDSLGDRRRRFLSGKIQLLLQTFHHVLQLSLIQLIHLPSSGDPEGKKQEMRRHKNTRKSLCLVPIKNNNKNAITKKKKTALMPNFQMFIMMFNNLRNYHDHREFS